MSSGFALHVGDPAKVRHSAPFEPLYWSKTDSTFISTSNGRFLGPSLGALGPVAPRNVDAVRIALAVTAADRSVPRARGGSNWNSRDFTVRVAVSETRAWNSVAKELGSLIGFLTGDRWTFLFNREASVLEEGALPTFDFKRVVLLSGGADSVIGALQTREELLDDEPYALVSHFSQGWMAPAQREIAESVRGLLRGPEQIQFQIHLNRRAQRRDGSTFRKEPSSRSRSFLFVTLGLALASVNEVPLWIPENGFASLNPPLGPDRLGSLSTKTTHPAFLSGLQTLLGRVGAHADLLNPFAELTKGEMFARLISLVGEKSASNLLSLTNSCAHTGHPGHRRAASVACGVCFGCVVRRAAFRAAGLEDKSEYADPAYSSGLANWLAAESIIPAVRAFTTRGVRTRDLLAMSLPDSVTLEAAADLCARGAAELKGYVG